MEKFTVGWFVLYTRPRHEKKIADKLEKIQVPAFLPTIKKLSQWSDRRKYVEAPLFPSYVFVKLDDSQSYFRSLEIDGVLHYVRMGKEIATVNESVINNLKLITSNYSDDMEISSERIRPGTILSIKEGPFTGFNCEVVQHKGKQKMLVRIELLQRSILMDVTSAQLATI